MSEGIPKGNVATDSGVIVEVLEGTSKGSTMLEAIAKRSLIPHASWVNIMECEYVLCRRVGHEKARESVSSFLSAGYLTIEENPSLHQLAAAVKCGRSISIVDCYTFAVAEISFSVPLFASRETEILREMKRKAFAVAPQFLGELNSD